MMDQWLELKCYKCLTKNFVCNGDLEDLTVEDISGFVCYNCSANNGFDEQFISIESKENQINNGYSNHNFYEKFRK